MASNITAGIRETTQVFEQDILRERIPRYIGRDGILTPYSQREALGQLWLKDMGGTHAEEVYVAHTMLTDEKMICILSYDHILLVEADDSKLERNIPLDSIESVEPSRSGVRLNYKKGSTEILPVKQETTSKWFSEIIERTMNQRIEENGKR
ncbi:hypothetical protein BDB01DRAFT_267270 [Pilobolus umbonatus]|nr:hypothetical protein BDB01DRAFT_267270 [Pilobolus umbonatus]